MDTTKYLADYLVFIFGRLSSRRATRREESNKLADCYPDTRMLFSKGQENRDPVLYVSNDEMK